MNNGQANVAGRPATPGVEEVFQEAVSLERLNEFRKQNALLKKQILKEKLRQERTWGAWIMRYITNEYYIWILGFCLGCFITSKIIDCFLYIMTGKIYIALFPEPEPKTIRQTFEDEVDYYYQQVLIYVWRLGYIIWRFGMLASVITLVSTISVFVILRKIKRFIMKRLYYKLVGVPILEEAAIEGSPLNSGVVPKYQVAIFAPGLVCNTHIGFGLRVSTTVLALPAHVWNRVAELGLTYVGLAGPTGKGSVPVKEVVAAKVVQDLVFLTLSAATFSSLGVSVGRLHTKTVTEASVQVTGVVDSVVKFSKGTIKPSSTLQFMYAYDGTTLPGFSGAAYSSGCVIYGMHTWANLDKKMNYGISSRAIDLELKSFLSVEATNDEMMEVIYEEPTSRSGVNRMMEEREKAFKELEKQLRTGEVPFKSKMARAFEEEALSSGEKVAMTALTTLTTEELNNVLEMFTKTVEMRGQSDDGEELEVKKRTVFEEFKEEMIEAVIEIINSQESTGSSEDYKRLAGRISTLEEKAKRDEFDVDNFDKLEQRVMMIETDLKNFINHQNNRSSYLEEKLNKLEKKEASVQEPSVSELRGKEKVQMVKAVKCPVAGCNRMFTNITAAKMHVGTYPKHQKEDLSNLRFQEESVPIDQLRQRRDGSRVVFESAWKSDYAERVKTMKSDQDFQKRSLSRGRSSQNSSLTSLTQLKQTLSSRSRQNQ